MRHANARTIKSQQRKFISLAHQLDGPHPGSDINKSNPQWLRSHTFRTRGLPGEGALRKPDIVISRGILLFKTRTDGGEGSKTPIFAGRLR